MINPKTQLEEPIMKKVREIITKAIEEKHELKLFDDKDTELENFVINNDEFWEYINIVRALLNYSEQVLSINGKSSFFDKYDFTEEDFFQYLTLIGQIWKVLDENIPDKEYSKNAFFHIEDDFDDFMTGIRRKIYELNFDKTEVWKELEKRIGKDILEPKDIMIDETRCPKCQSTNRAEILWGTVDKKAVKEMKKRKEIVLGGCLVSENEPKWHCNDCRTRWGLSDFSRRLQHEIEKGTYKKEYPRITQNKNLDQPIEKLDDKGGIHSVPETKKVEEIPARIWVKRELASAIGITICSKCGTRTKMIKTHLDSDFPSAGYATCPKCGRKEKWRVGE